MNKQKEFEKVCSIQVRVLCKGKEEGGRQGKGIMIGQRVKWVKCVGFN